MRKIFILEISVVAYLVLISMTFTVEAEKGEEKAEGIAQDM